MGCCGLDVSKISLMGRWCCAVVLHYTRLSPISDIARDYKRARATHGIDDTIKTISVSQRKIKETVDAMVTGIQAEVSALAGKVEAVSRDNMPRDIVVNKTTGKIHKVLTTTTDAGGEVAAFCGLKYAYCPKEFRNDIPSNATRANICGSCFKELRDSMPKQQHYSRSGGL